jgi:hypothetical protein
MLYAFTCNFQFICTLHIKYPQPQAFLSLRWESDCKLRMQVNFDVTPCWWVSGARRLDWSYYVRVVGSWMYDSVIPRNIGTIRPKHIVIWIVSYTAVRTLNLIRLWNCSRFREEATVTYCAIGSDKVRFCELVSSDLTRCVLFWDVCLMLFLCDLRCTQLFR